jgi:hypothetical protein
VRFSPLGFRPTVTFTVLALTLAGVILHGLSGQAIGPGRYLIALVRYRLARKRLDPPTRPDGRGFVLDAIPPPAEEPPAAAAALPEWEAV